MNNTDSPTPTHVPSSPSSGPTLSAASNNPPVPPPPENPPPPANLHQMTTRRKNLITKPNPKYNYSAALSRSVPAEPRMLNQALKEKRWRGAMSTEIDAFAVNRTFDLVPRQPHFNVVRCRWIYTNKFLSSGEHNRCKARLIAKGYTQQPGQDYTETFSPVIKATTIHTVLDIAVSRSWPIKQLDVNNAFLQCTLNEEVYMEQSPGFVDSDHPSYICRLNKAVYGLKQAPRAWYTELRNFLLSLGFLNSLADSSLFILKTGTHFIYLLVYVDDILVTCSSKDGIKRILQLLADRFSIKDPEDLNYFPGLEAHRASAGLHLSQCTYVLNLLHRYDMTNSKPVTTSMATSPKLTLTTGKALSDPKEYRQLVGSLQYLQFTRLDIAFAVNKLSQFMHCPTEDHWQAAK